MNASISLGEALKLVFSVLSRVEQEVYLPGFRGALMLKTRSLVVTLISMTILAFACRPAFSVEQQVEPTADLTQPVESGVAEDDPADDALGTEPVNELPDGADDEASSIADDEPQQLAAGNEKTSRQILDELAEANAMS